MIIIGEKINGSIPSVAKAIQERNADHIRHLAEIQTQAGATYIDILSSVPVEIEVETMKWLIETVQEATDLPISIDSPNPETLVECMPFVNKPGLLNSVSGEGNKMDVVFPAIQGTKCNVAALLNGNYGIPKTAADRLKVFDEIMEKAAKFDIAPNRIHVDPLVEMLCTAEDGINMIAEVMETMREKYPTIHITGACSNISFNLPARKIMNQAFIVLSIYKGMDSAILDPTNSDLMGMVYAAEALKGDDEMCINYISAYRDGLFGQKKAK